MDNSDRPLSPHLQVYRLPLTGLLSIFHRITGVILSIGLLFFVVCLMALAGGPDSFAVIQAALHSTVGKIVLFAWTYALFFHLCHGIRHLIWDTGSGFLKEDMNKMAAMEIMGSILLTLFVWGGTWFFLGGH